MKTSRETARPPGAVKPLFTLTMAGVLMLLALVRVWATDTKFFASPSNAYGATNFYTIVPAVGGKVAVVRTLEVTTDLTAARVTVYTNGNQVVFPYSVSSSNIQVEATGTNGLAAGDNVLIQVGNSASDSDYYYRVRIVTVSTTNLLYTPTISGTLAAGSKLWRLGTNTFFYGMTNGATSPRNSFIAVSQRGQPMVIDVNAGAAGSINATGEHIE